MEGQIKSILSFFKIDMNSGWSTPEGYPEGIQEKILSGKLSLKRDSGAGRGFSGLRQEFIQHRRLFTITGKRFI